MLELTLKRENMIQTYNNSFCWFSNYTYITSLSAAKLWHCIRSTREKNNKAFSLFDEAGTSEDCKDDNIIGELSQVNPKELVLFDFERLATATNNFHVSNKLGQGGFGPVYKVPKIQ